MALDLRSCELEHAFIKERISNIEKHFSDISLKFAAYIKKLSQVRDSGDDLAGSISSFAAKENLNLSLRKCLLQFTDTLKAVQEYRDAQIQRTDVKVVLEFANYKPICKMTKAELKTRLDVRAKEISMKNQLEKTRVKNPTNWQKIAEKEAFRAQDEATHASLELSKRLDNFEHQKLQDIKHTLLEYIKIELMFQAKALELYTTAYNQIKNINMEEDLREFRSHFMSYSTPLAPENIPSNDPQAHIQMENSTGDLNTNGTTGQFVIMANPVTRSSLENKASHFVTSTPKATPKDNIGMQKLDICNQ